MKKIFLTLILILIIILGIIGFNYYKNYENKNEVDNTKNQNVIEDEKIEKEEKKEEVIIPLGLYLQENSKRKLIKEYENKWQYHTDIAVFSVFYTNEEEIPYQRIYKSFDNFKPNVENIDLYRIGYKIEFNTQEENINRIIISPKDTEDFYNYLEVYLYDDYHRNGEWYSHTTETEFNEETLLTSIKLTAGKEINSITSDIKLTTFLYNNKEINDSDYVGNNNYSIIVKRINN